MGPPGARRRAYPRAAVRVERKLVEPVVATTRRKSNWRKLGSPRDLPALEGRPGRRASRVTACRGSRERRPPGATVPGGGGPRRPGPTDRQDGLPAADEQPNLTS